MAQGACGGESASSYFKKYLHLPERMKGASREHLGWSIRTPGAEIGKV